MTVSVHIEADDAFHVRKEMLALLGTGVVVSTPNVEEAKEQVVAIVTTALETAPAEEPKKPRGRKAAAAPTPAPELPIETVDPATGETVADEEEEAVEEAEELGDTEEDDDDMIGGFVLTTEGVKAAMKRYSEVFGMEQAQKNIPAMLGAPKFSEFAAAASPASISRALKSIASALAAA